MERVLTKNDAAVVLGCHPNTVAKYAPSAEAVAARPDLSKGLVVDVDKLGGWLAQNVPLHFAAVDLEEGFRKLRVMKPAEHDVTPVEVIETYVEQARAEGLQGIDNLTPGSFDLLTATVFYPDQAPFTQSGV